MITEALFKAASDIFFDDLRVRALRYTIYGYGYEITAASHQIEEGEDIPLSYKSAMLTVYDDKVVAMFPSDSTDSFLEGPSRIEWDADGTRTDYAYFDGEERAMTAHDKLRYAALNQEKTQELQKAREMDARVEEAGDFLMEEILRLENEPQQGENAKRFCFMRGEILSAKQDQDHALVEKLLAQVDAMRAKVAA